MPFENFPYSDYHNLNLDWLLKKVKDMADVINMVNIPALVNAKIEEMVDDGTLAQIINQQLFDELDQAIHDLANDQYLMGLDITRLKHRTTSANVVMLSRPDGETSDPSRGYSLCMVVYNTDFCIVYDTGNDNADKLINYLRSKGITKIDAMIISHYHNDHVTTTGVNALLGSGIDIVKWYLPHGAINWASFNGTTYSSVEAAIKSAITAAGQTYEEPASEGESVALANQVNINFYNVTAGYFSGYYGYLLDEDIDPTGNTNYNNFSMCCRIAVGGKVLALTGDIEEPAQNNMAGMVKGADIVQLPHHGLDLRDSYSFISALSAKIYLTAAYGLARFQRLRVVSNELLAHARNTGVSVSTLPGTTIEGIIGGSGCYLIPSSSGEVTPIGSFGQVIPSGDDLDNYETIGFVGYIKNAAAAGNIANTPTNETGAGRVLVTASNQNSNGTTGSVMQWYITSFSYGDPHIYVRWKYEGTWEPWQDYEADLAT